MTQELRDRVARAIVEADVTPEGSVADLMSCPGYMKNIYGFADAAIAIIRAEVLEEAAKECERIETEEHQKWKKHADMMAQGASDGAGDCAAAIRALKEKP